MSEEMLEELREFNRWKTRLGAVESWLASTERERFSRYDVEKMIQHIKLGKGWI